MKSNICKESVFNNSYDNILCIFNTENKFYIEFKKPTYFLTRKELLSDAKFTIVNLKTHDQPNWDEGAPTFIHLIIQPRMTKTFNIFMESNDAISKIKFPKNNNMEFTIDLPERFRLNGWQVCLKSLLIPSKIWNIYEDTMPSWQFKTNNKSIIGLSNHFEFPEGSYEVIDILHLMQHVMTFYKLPVNIMLNEQKNRVVMKLKRKSVDDSHYYAFIFNGYLNKILGFTFKAEEKVISLAKDYHTQEAHYAPNIHAYTPKSIIVTCDIAADTIFGGERLKLLRLITNKMERHGDTVHYDFFNDEYVNLRTHEFERITVRISDVTGEALKIDYREIESRVQLEFRETKST